jgi:membrane fusion protein, multidrug efflux system
VAATPRAVVRFREFPGREFPVVRALRSGVFDPDVGTMRIELVIANGEFLLPAGMTGTATFTLDVAPGTFLVPTNAVQLREGVASLAIVDGGKVRRLEVGTGRTLGTRIEVVSAQLTPTTPVIVNPNALLRDGDAVQIAPPTGQ